jgi:uncharacterized protein (TIGR00255 family)
MMISMTGFGQAESKAKGECFLVTLKSVNHRYFETSFHLAPHLEHVEGMFRTQIQEKIKRGRITVAVTHVNETDEEIVLNEKLVDKYYEALEKMRRRLRLDGPIDLASLVTLPGVLRSKKEELSFGAREKLLKGALHEALAKLLAMKVKEGAALATDMASRVRKITQHMTTIKKLVAAAVEAHKKTLPPENLEGYLRSTDVGEEVTRIDFHLKSFLKHMRVREPKGKVLDFIGQELQREINTLGAKVQEKNVAYQVVMVKDLIEKIREQVQNVE